MGEGKGGSGGANALFEWLVQLKHYFGAGLRELGGEGGGERLVCGVLNDRFC